MRAEIASWIRNETGSGSDQLKKLPHVVGLEWIDACWEARTWVDEGRFAVFKGVGGRMIANVVLDSKGTALTSMARGSVVMELDGVASTKACGRRVDGYDLRKMDSVPRLDSSQEQDAKAGCR